MRERVDANLGRGGIELAELAGEFIMMKRPETGLNFAPERFCARGVGSSRKQHVAGPRARAAAGEQANAFGAAWD